MSVFSHNQKANIITNESIDTIPNLRALLNQILASLDGDIEIADVEGLTTALNNKLETSLLKTTLVGDLDTDIPSVKATNAALALKADVAIGFTALADNTTSISKSSFAGGQAITISYTDGLNKTITLDNDMKDGKEYIVEMINAHGTISILNTFPIPCITDSNGQVNVPNITRVYVSIYWHNLAEAWVLNWGGAMVVKNA